MRAYAYVAYTPDGKRRRGVIVAENEAGASAQIAARGLLPSEISLRSGAVREGPRRRRGRRIDREMLSVFTRQMAVLLSAGLSVDAALEALQGSASAARIEELSAQAKAALMDGESLSTALDRAGEMPAYYLAAVRAGENSGELASVFATLADYLESSASDRAQLASALIYPAFVVAVSVFVCGVLMVTVAPEIVTMFESSGRELPPLTQVMLSITDFITDTWELLLAALAGLVALGVASGRVPALRQRRDRLMLRVPLAGRFMRLGASAQYLRTLSLVVNSRLPLVDALQHAAGVLTVQGFRDEAEAAGEGLRRGESLTSALGRLTFLPAVAKQLVQAGEASARLGPMTDRAAVLSETWLRTERKRLATLLEPALMVVVGGLVLMIVLSVLLPIFDMQAVVAGG